MNRIETIYKTDNGQYIDLSKIMCIEFESNIIEGNGGLFCDLKIYYRHDNMHINAEQESYIQLSRETPTSLDKYYLNDLWLGRLTSNYTRDKSKIDEGKAMFKIREATEEKYKDLIDTWKQWKTENP